MTDEPALSPKRGSGLRVSPHGSTLKVCLIVLAAAAPDIVMRVLRQHVYMNRALIDIDYYALCALAAGISPTFAAMLLLACTAADIVASMDVVYSFRLDEAILSLRELPQLSWPAATVILAATLLIATYWRAIASTIRRGKHRVAVVLLACIAVAATIIDRTDLLKRAGLSDANLATSGAYGVIVAFHDAFNQRMHVEGVSHATVVAAATTVVRPELFRAFTARHDVVLVLMEALTIPKDTALWTWMTSDLRLAAAAGSMTWRSGAVPFNGYTTAAEMRELCGVLGSHLSAPRTPQPTCIPAIARTYGYSTVAFHGFTARLFDRASWLPKLGFDSLFFARQLFDAGARSATSCGIAYLGTCDSTVASLIARRLGGSGRPLFAYWLTLNTHIPVRGSAWAGDERDCVSRFPTSRPLCAWAAAQRSAMRAAGRLLAAGAQRPITLLLVGDHAPPFALRSTRTLVNQASVPFILIQK